MKEKIHQLFDHSVIFSLDYNDLEVGVFMDLSFCAAHNSSQIVVLSIFVVHIVVIMKIITTKTRGKTITTDPL